MPRSHTPRHGLVRKFVGGKKRPVGLVGGKVMRPPHVKTLLYKNNITSLSGPTIDDRVGGGLKHRRAHKTQHSSSSIMNRLNKAMSGMGIRKHPRRKHRMTGMGIGCL